jgi:adenylate kinase
VNSGSALGQEVKEIMTSGSLVSDELMIKIVEKRMSQNDVKKGFILDGFPRTIPQAEQLALILASKALPTPAVILMEVPREILVERLTGRLTCSGCGRAFHRTLNPPRKPGECDLCGSALVERKDDSLETAKKRLEVYGLETQPLIDFYAKRGALKVIPADRPMSAISSSLKEALGVV